jgi:hypothetical protein
MASATSRDICSSSVVFGARSSLPITYSRTWPSPTYDSRLTAVFDRSMAAK